MEEEKRLAHSPRDRSVASTVARAFLFNNNMAGRWVGAQKTKRTLGKLILTIPMLTSPFVKYSVSPFVRSETCSF